MNTNDGDKVGTPLKTALPVTMLRNVSMWMRASSVMQERVPGILADDVADLAAGKVGDAVSAAILHRVFWGPEVRQHRPGHGPNPDPLEPCNRPHCQHSTRHTAPQNQNGP